MKKVLTYFLIIFTLITSIFIINIYDNFEYTIYSKLINLKDKINNKSNKILLASNDLISINDFKIEPNIDYFHNFSKDEKIFLLEKFVNNNINHKIKVKDISIVEDVNKSKFFLVNFKPIGYAIVKYETLEFFEINYNDNIKITNLKDNIYIPLKGFDNKTNYNLMNKPNYGYNLSLNRSIEKFLPDNDFVNKYTETISNLNYKADIEVPYSWYFRYNFDKFAYYDKDRKEINHNGNGVCEYIALLMLLVYNECFVSSGYFNNDDIKKYFTISNGQSIDNYIPKINYKLLKNIFELNDEATNIDAGLVSRALSRFEENRYQDYYTKYAYFFTADPYSIIKKGIPTMLSFYLGKKEGHNVVAYGYDLKKSMYLCHYGFQGSQYTQVLINRKPFNFIYDWSIRDNKDVKNPVRKLFNYKGKLVTGKEIIL